MNIKFKKCIFTVTKEKTKIIGYWLDSEGKLYKDNIKPVKVFCDSQADELINSLFAKGEKAIFMTGDNAAYIINKNDAFDILPIQILKYYKLETLTDDFIKRLCKKYNGLTIDYNHHGTLADCIEVIIWTK
jgi:hypothetical protein